MTIAEFLTSYDFAMETTDEDLDVIMVTEDGTRLSVALSGWESLPYYAVMEKVKRWRIDQSGNGAEIIINCV